MNSKKIYKFKLNITLKLILKPSIPTLILKTFHKNYIICLYFQWSVLYITNTDNIIWSIEINETLIHQSYSNNLLTSLRN